MRVPFSPRIRFALLVLMVSAAVGGAAAKLNSSGDLVVGAASTRVLVDYPEASIADRRALSQDVSTLQKRAELYGRLLTTKPVLAAVARRAGVPAAELSGVARTTAAVPIPLTQPDSEIRASQIVASRMPYRLELQASPELPILTIYAAAPSADAAVRLANAGVSGLEDFLRGLARRQDFRDEDLPRLRVLGGATGGVVNTRAKPVIAAVTFIVAAGICAALLFGLAEWRRRRRAGPRAVRARAPRWTDDWPRTTRVLPWTLAAFITILWLTPFDRIQLTMQTPIDMKLDRLLLPFVFLVWAAALFSEPRGRPRLKLTGIHVALGVLIALSFLSVVLDARYLNHTGELMLSLKKLPLLVSYVSVFWFISTSLRPSEIHAFLSLTLGLSLIVALGIIWEFRFETNVFSMVVDKLLPPVLQLSGGTSVSYDSLGRRGIVGPTAVGLEAVTVFALGLPIVIVRLLGTAAGKRRLFYALAACILIAAMFATGRKSALLAPLSVIATLAYFRRRELLRLAPVGLVVAVAVSVLSPGAVHGTISQFLRPDSGSVATTSDRTADYDAVRPDVFTHLLFGRGYGSYNHDTYRILDSEILGRTIETGVLGLAAFLMVGLSIVLVTRRTIAERGRYAPAALIGAAAGICFVTVSTLYDVTGFPHATYLFLTLAGFAAVVANERAPASRPRGPAPPAGRSRAARPADGERTSTQLHDALI